VDVRYFELQDLLCTALIALEAGDTPAAARAVERALRWAEADWLASASVLPAGTPSSTPEHGGDGDD
jgi:hypothetical protein